MRSRLKLLEIALAFGLLDGGHELGRPRHETGRPQDRFTRFIWTPVIRGGHRSDSTESADRLPSSSTPARPDSASCVLDGVLEGQGSRP